MIRVRIGSAVDHDMSLYRFERTSGLPHGTFGPTREQRMSRRAWVSCAWLALAIALGILL